MSKVTSKQWLKKKGIHLIFLIFCGTCIFENTLSIKQWDRENIKVKYNKSDRIINISVEFFDYEFGAWGEHGYLHWCEFCFSYDGLHYEKLFVTEVNDQIKTNETWIVLKDKLLGTKIKIYRCSEPHIDMTWYDHQSYRLWFPVISNKACYGVNWFLPLDKNIEDIKVKGQWNVNRLNCPYLIKEKYLIKDEESMKTDSKK